MQDKFLQIRDFITSKKEVLFSSKKRSIIVILLVILLPIGVFLALQQTIFNPRAGIADVGMSISTPDGLAKDFGQPFPVSLSLKQTGGASLVGVGVVLEYDPTILEPVNAPAAQGCIVKGPVQICDAKSQNNQSFRPFPFVPRDPVVDASAGRVSFSALSYDESTGETSDAFQHLEFRDFAKVYFKSKLPGSTNVLIVNNGPDDTTTDSNVAAVGSAADYLITNFPGERLTMDLALNIKDPVPFGIYSVKEIAAPNVIAYTNTLEVSGWAVSPGSTVERYDIYLNGNQILSLPKSDPRVIRNAHPEPGVCGNTEAQEKYPDCQGGANVGFKINVTKEELENGGVDFRSTTLETKNQKLEVKTYAQISQGDEFEGILSFGSLDGSKDLSFFFDDPGNKGNPATYVVTKNGNNFAVNIRPQRERGTYPYVGLVINGNKAQPKRLELVTENPVEFKWDSTNSYDGQTFADGTYSLRLYAHCEYNSEDRPVSCDNAGIAFEPHYFTISTGSGGGSQTGGISPQNSKGFIDTATCTIIDGWACHPDNFGSSVQVILSENPVNADGTFTGQTTTATANRNRVDLATAANTCNGTTAHGFSINTPGFLKSGSERQVYVYAKDPSGKIATNALVSSSTGQMLRVTCN